MNTLEQFKAIPSGVGSKLLKHVEQVEAYMVNGQVLIWDSNCAYTLRSKYRIVGANVGSLPISGHQNQCLGMPLMLLPEETTLLLSKGFLKLYDASKSPISIDNNPRNHDILLQARYLKKQKDNTRRKQEKILEFKKQISAEKKDETSDEQPRKRLRSSEEESPEEKEQRERKEKLKKGELRIALASGLFRRIDTKCEGKDHTDQIAAWDFPQTEVDKLRCKVFADLWDRGFFLTSASKFGGDFLAYPGDPIRCHSCFCVICIPWTSALSPHDIVSYGRLGVSVKKVPVLATIEPDNKKLRYFGLEWAGGL